MRRRAWRVFIAASLLLAAVSAASAQDSLTGGSRSDDEDDSNTVAVELQTHKATTTNSGKARRSTTNSAIRNGGGGGDVPASLSLRGGGITRDASASDGADGGTDGRGSDGGGHRSQQQLQQRPSVTSTSRRPFPIVLPSPKENTKLTLQKQGLDMLRSIKGPVAPVVVIGPYRSGKSFLLNQLLGVPCGEGFGVGHTRKTETKGVWVWGEPVKVNGGGGGGGGAEAGAETAVSVVYVDTEGFEATGMSDAYDDRIFALSSIVASVLIYNLPETVKEGDIEKLSFAVELAQEFYSRAQHNRGGSGGGGGGKNGHGGEGDEDEEEEEEEEEEEDEAAAKKGVGSSDKWGGVGGAIGGAEREGGKKGGGGDGGVARRRRQETLRETFLPNSLLWLIQRDFLEGSTVNEMVKGALKPVANPGKDKHVDELNRIRKSLRALAKNSTAFGLKQPHLQRTKLCQLKDDELEPAYVKQREQLRALVRREAHAKIVAGPLMELSGGSGLMTGPALATLIERSVRALNEGDFPSAGNVVDSFNRDVLERHLAEYKAALESIKLPALEEDLVRAHESAAYRALEGFRRDRFGRGAVTAASLKRHAEELYSARVEKNAFASGRECESSSSACEDELVSLQTMRLPSVRKFDDSLATCNATWSRRCVGPSRATYAARLSRSAARERTAFLQSYNARLLNGLLVASIAGIVIFRFLVRVGLLELASWGLFVILEVSPKLYIGPPGATMFESTWWTTAAKAWEVVVYNPFVDLDEAGPALGVFVLGVVLWVRIRGCVRWCLLECCPCFRGLMCCLNLLCCGGFGGGGVGGGGGGRRKKKTVQDRDLDV